MNGQTDTLCGLLAAVALFHHHRNEMPVQQAHMLLTIARRPGINAADLFDELGLIQSSCSRNLNGRGSWIRHVRHGLGSIRLTADPAETRRL